MRLQFYFTQEAGVVKPIPADFKSMVNMESCPNKRSHFEAVNRCSKCKSIQNRFLHYNYGP